MYVGENNPLDVYNASKFTSIIKFPNITVHSIQDSGHALKSYFDKKNETASLIKSFIENKISNTLLDEGSACSTPGFADLYLKQTKSKKHKEWKESIHYGIGAIALYPYCAKAQYMLGMAYLQIGDLNNALTHCSVSRSISPTNLDYQFAIANIFRRMGMIQKSKYLHNKILQNNKKYSRSHYELSLIYASIGDKKNTLARIKYAQALEPNNISFQKRALIFNKKFKYA